LRTHLLKLLTGALGLEKKTPPQRRLRQLLTPGTLNLSEDGLKDSDYGDRATEVSQGNGVLCNDMAADSERLLVGEVFGVDLETHRDILLAEVGSSP